MIEVIRSTIALPKTRTVITDGHTITVWTKPDERQQRRRWREYYRPLPCAEANA